MLKEFFARIPGYDQMTKLGKGLVRRLPGFRTIHILQYAKDLTIAPNDPERSGQNVEMVGFPNLLEMSWYIHNTPAARAAFRADRFRLLSTPRTEMTEGMILKPKKTVD